MVLHFLNRLIRSVLLLETMVVPMLLMRPCCFWKAMLMTVVCATTGDQIEGYDLSFCSGIDDHRLITENNRY